MNQRAFWLAVLIAGVVTGLLGGLPLISLLNCVLCLWVWLGAILSVLLYRNFEGTKRGVTTGQGATLGLVTGLIGAIVVWILGFLTRGAAMAMINQFAQQYGGGAIPTGLFATGVSFISLLVDLVLYAIFGAIGGLIGAAIFRGPSAPVATTTYAPPPAPYQSGAPVVPPPAPAPEPPVVVPEPVPPEVEPEEPVVPPVEPPEEEPPAGNPPMNP